MEIIEKNVTLAECQLSIIEFNKNLHSVEELTSLLHKSYKELTDLGLYFLAATQSVATTLERIENGTCLIALKGGELIGTICYYPSTQNEVSKWFTRFDVGHFGQFAVDPDYRRIGLGRLLISMVEEIAAQDTKQHLALDTAEKATSLIEYYNRLGFQQVGYMQWGHYNYRSVVMNKQLMIGFQRMNNSTQ